MYISDNPAAMIGRIVLTLIIGIIILRLMIRGFIIFKNKTITGRTILSETAAAFCIGAPLALYLLLRLAFAEPAITPYAGADSFFFGGIFFGYFFLTSSSLIQIFARVFL